jgi:hypothetical protein
MTTIGLAGMAAPALATTGVAAAPLAEGQSAAGFTTAKINVNPPDSTYALVTFQSVTNGINIKKVVFTGVMAGKGCVTAVLYRNKQATRNTPKKCYPKGTRVTATWTNFGFRPIGDQFKIDFLGTGAPKGVEAFSVTKQ